MKQKKPVGARSDHLQVYFILFIFVLLALSIGAGALLTLLIEWLTQTRFTLPTIVWMILLSIAMGLVLSLICPVLCGILSWCAEKNKKKQKRVYTGHLVNRSK